MNETEKITGVVFNIQHYSIHDGPGIRTTVFIKGCRLRCVWCQNPESQSFEPELFFNADKCTGCGLCVETCPEGAIEISQGHSKTDRTLCMSRGRCVEVCPNEARNLMGNYITTEEVFSDVIEDEIFYKNSGGGVTLSGGEPLASPEFTITLLKLLKKAGIHTALDTCGYAQWEIIQNVLNYVDLVLFDFKHMNPVEHQKYTGVSNEPILDNARRIHRELNIPMLARVPVVPGYNDSIENIEATAKFIANELGTSTHVHLLPYHRLGEAKYERLEETDKTVLIEPPGEQHISKLIKIFESFSLTVHEGG